MQTFLPFPDFAQTASVLDTQRLGKQREEAATLLETLIIGKGLWIKSGCAEMWKGAEVTLWKYTVAICKEYADRGRVDGILECVQDLMMDALKTGHLDVSVGHLQPWWLGNPGLHLAHKSALVQKDPKYYRSVFPDVADNLPMIWPEWRNPVKAP